MHIFFFNNKCLVWRNGSVFAEKESTSADIFSFFGDLLLPPGAWPVSQKEHPTYDDTPHMKVTLGYPLGG